MNVEQRIRREEPEDLHLEYTSKKATSHKIARELAAFANAEGGTIVVGIRDDENGSPDEIEDVRNTDDIARSASDVLYERVAPPLDFDSELIEIDSCTLLSLSVSPSEDLRSYEHKGIEEPVFPVRRQTEVRYLSGNEVSQHFEEVYSQQNQKYSDELLRLSDEELETGLEEYFIKSPDGHISEICLFSDIHYPGDLRRIRVSDDYLPEQKVEHIFACLDAVFDISVGDAYFTLNQENGAWIGRGFKNFVSNLRNREKRYTDIIEGDYELELYGDEQAVLTADFGMVYPESAVIIYAAPFSNEEGYRHLTINFLIKGDPIDVRPLIEFSERTDLYLGTSEETNIIADGFEDTSSIPVEVIERTTRPNSIGEGGSVDGAICGNPFFGRDELLNQELKFGNPSPLAKYEKLYGFLHDWDDPRDPHKYDAKRLVIHDWNSFTEGVYANVKEVQFGINW
jgi:hypothetical protein